MQRAQSAELRQDPLPVQPTLFREWPLPAPGEDKHDRGSVLVVGGAAQTPGAALLAGLGALRVGAGQLRMAVAATAAPASAIAAPEALVAGLTFGAGHDLRADLTLIGELMDGVDCVCLGPGLADAPSTGGLVSGILGQLPETSLCVVDAVALEGLAKITDLVRSIGRRLLLTPNPAESALMLGRNAADPPSSRQEIIETSHEAAQRFGCTVTLRGCTAASDGSSWLDPSGDAGLATSGSGDVLAGMAAGLLARGCTPEQAGVWAARLHARCGERLVSRVGSIGYLARELLDEAPAALVDLAAGSP